MSGDLASRIPEERAWRDLFKRTAEAVAPPLAATERRELSPLLDRSLVGKRIALRSPTFITTIEGPNDSCARLRFPVNR